MSTRAMPTYELEKVEVLPEQVEASRSSFYLRILEHVAKDAGEWYRIARFQTAAGARNAANALGKGERNIPEGEWEFEARRVSNPDDPIGPKHSELYARFLG